MAAAGYVEAGRGAWGSDAAASLAGLAGPRPGWGQDGPTTVAGRGPPRCAVAGCCPPGRQSGMVGATSAFQGRLALVSWVGAGSGCLRGGHVMAGGRSPSRSRHPLLAGRKGVKALQLVYP